ncbi:MAG: imidazolonepropionase [Candidatus Eisenbacteria sp.]|nr:imidazolonepropionase [Candidatus Eisenbacteria bacterium]
MREVSILLHSARQLLTMAPAAGGRPKVGSSMADLGILEDGALAADGERILAVGHTDEIRSAYQLRPGGVEMDATGCVVMPAFVDPHTHVLFHGTREWEFEERLRGKTYMEIAAEGGGIHASVRMFREASDETLLAESLARMDRMAAFGTGTVEIKTGYALDPEQELRALRLIGELSRRHPLHVVATYLGAHEIPSVHRGDPDTYVDLLVKRMIPEAADLGIARFCDVFCEQGVFSIEQSRRILETGKRVGLRPKLHADEIEPMGGAELAAEVQAISADHLGKVSEQGMRAMAEAGVVAVLLPATLFSLRAQAYAPARRMIELGVAVALATDCNPGSSMTESQPWVMALACLEMGMTPAEAVTATTYNAAAALGLAADRGALSPGYRADIQILDAPSYARLPYHVGFPDQRDLFLSGRHVIPALRAPELRIRVSGASLGGDELCTGR